MRSPEEEIVFQSPDSNKSEGTSDEANDEISQDLEKINTKLDNVLKKLGTDLNETPVMIPERTNVRITRSRMQGMLGKHNYWIQFCGFNLYG